MNLRYLRYFMVLAEERHFHRAADRLHIEQSPLSRAIRTVEHELGVTLFDRSQRGTSLTREGQALLGETQRVLQAYDQLQRTASALSHCFDHTVRVGLAGMTVGLAHPRLAQWLGRARQGLDNVDLQIVECDDATLVRDLQDGVLDVGVTVGDIGTPDLVARELWHDPVMVVVPVGHALTKLDSVALEHVHAYPLILGHPQSDGAASVCLRALVAMHESTPVIGQYARSIQGMLTMVAAGFGVSFMVQSQTRLFARQDVSFIPLNQDDAVFSTWVLHRPGALRSVDQRFLALA